MRCPRCGSDAVSALGYCSQCGSGDARPLNPGVATTTAVTIASSGDPDVTTGFPGTPVGSGAHSIGLIAPGQPFGTRYQIIRVLGAGGMGVVYQAWDSELGVAVALKVIRPEVLQDAGAAGEVQRRFKRELVLARQVTHKNVVRIHDLGEIGGIKYLTMPFVEGENLADLLKRQGKLPLPQALGIARQVASGLSAAHAVGVVHRDLKPENIMISADGEALIMDFGISRSVTGTGTTTQLGAVLGTLEYMPPEQAQGKAVDHRADLYSFGLMLHDMLAGRQRLAAGDNPMTEMLARMQKGVAPIRSIDPSVPQPVERILQRCVATDPDARYATTGELVHDLEALTPDGHVLQLPAATGQGGVPRRTVAIGSAVSMLIVLAAAAGLWWTAKSRDSGGNAPPRESISVLVTDFANRANDPVFEGAVEQALTIALEGASFITTYPRKDAMRTVQRLKPGAPLDENAGKLVSLSEGIKVVLAGEVLKTDRGYTINAHAVDPVTNNTLSSASETASSKEQVLAAVAALAAKVRLALGDTRLEDLESGLRETMTSASLDAAREYAIAQRLAEEDKDEQAVIHYQQAVSLDQGFGRAYSGWASSALKLGRRSEAQTLYEESLKRLDRMTEREKYRTLGAYYIAIAGDHEKGIENYSTLVRKFPADGAGHNNLAVAYFNILDFPKALEEGRRVVEIYPKSVLYRYNYALYAMYAGDFEKAAEQANEAIKLNPSTPKAYLALAMAALAANRPNDARAAYEKAATTGTRGASLSTMGLADLAMLEGRFTDAVGLLEQGIARDVLTQNHAAVAAKRIALGEAHIAIGDQGAALKAIDGALEKGRSASVLVPAARVLVDAGREDQAKKIAADLHSRLPAGDRASAHLIDALVALKAGRANEAVKSLHVARKLTDFWLVRFTLGVAYVEAGQTSYAAALSELELCQKRIGESTAVFLDDVPSFRYMGPVKYWLGRAQEGMGNKEAAAENYRSFLTVRKGPAGDRLSADARRRLGLR